MKCNWCECSKLHIQYWECSLLNNNNICCNYDVVSADPKTRHLEFIKVIKEATGKDVTDEQIIETCLECRKGINFRLLL